MKRFRRNSPLGKFLALAVIGLSGLAAEYRAQSLPADAPKFAQIAPGIEHVQMVRQRAAKEDGDGPWLINALRIDLNLARLRIVHALDEAVGLETVSSLAARYGSVAATNAGYFRTTGTFRGESVGTLMIDRKLLSEPNHERASVGLLPNSRGLVFGHVRFRGILSVAGKRHKIDGLNRPVAADELVVFTPEFHRTTLTSPEGVEVVVRNRRVSAVSDKAGSTRIPADGYVISATGNSRSWILKHLKRGTLVSLMTKLEPIASDASGEWSQVQSITGGGPQLIKDGKVSITNEAERIGVAFVSDRHPRTAIAKLTSGQILLLTVDGRQPGVSVGMSLPGLAELLLEFGASEAINLDGGGSTTMVVKNKIVNRPSDQTGERPVSDAILIYSRAQ